MHRHLLLVAVLFGASALALGGPVARPVSTDPQHTGLVAANVIGDVRPVLRETAPGSAPAGPLGVRLASPRPLPASFLGASRGAAAMRQGRMPAEALASADFDEDGMPDLVVAHRGADGSGAIALYRGNADAVYPNEPEARRRRASGTFVDAPFLADATVFDTPEGGALLGAGDFDADGHRDAVVARRGGVAIFWHRGDGRGSLDPATRISVPGPITDLVVGDINRRDGLEDIVVAVQVGEEGRLLVFEGLTGALASAPEEIPLAAHPSSIGVGRLDEDGFADLAIASGRTLEVIRGRDRGLYLDQARRGGVAPPVALRAPLPFTLQSLAVGEFDGR